MRGQKCLLLVVILLVPSLSMGADECGFSWVTPVPPRVDLHRAFQRSGLVVAVGDRGTIVTTTNGAHWEMGRTDCTADLFGVDWGEGHFIVVGDGVVLTSTNGERWTTRWQQDGLRLDDVDYGVGHFVAVGEQLGARALVSTSGVSWSLQEVAWSGGARSVVWTGDSFVVAATDGAFRSLDGSSWLRLGDPPSSEMRLLKSSELPRIDLGWDGSSFFWVEGMQVFSSTDGADWQLVYTLDGCAAYSALTGVWAEPGAVIIGGTAACPDPYINPFSILAVSTNGGDDWQTVVDERAGGINGIVRDGGQYLAVGGSGEVRIGGLLSDWHCVPGTCNDEACVEGFFDLAVESGTRVAVGGVGRCTGFSKRRTGATILRSTDGRSWTMLESEDDRLLAVAATGAGFVAVGDDVFSYSADGLEWSQEDLDRNALLTAIASNGDILVTVGLEGVILTSDDGADWAGHFSHHDADLYGVDWTGHHFVAVGVAGTVQWSTDGAHWTDPVSVTGRDLYGITSSAERVYVGGAGGTIYSTADFEEWRPEESGVTGEIHDLCWDGEHLLAVGSEESADDEAGRGIFLISGDGVHWSRISAPGFGLRRVESTAGEVISVGFDRSAIRATCFERFVTVDPPRAEIGIGDTLELAVELSETSTSAAVISLVSSHPSALQVPSEVEIAAGATSATVLAFGAGLVSGARVSASLQGETGVSTATARIDVEPPLPDPRRVNGRRHP